MADGGSADGIALQHRLREVQKAARALQVALGRLDEAAGRLDTDIARGATFLEAYTDASLRESRDGVFAATGAFDAAFTAARAEGVRVLVDGGMSLSEAARVVGRSRQFVTRLYRQATEGST